MRHKHDGTITNAVAYPLTAALYGQRIRQPIGGDFCISGDVARSYAESEDWDGDVCRFGVDVWMTTVLAGRRETDLPDVPRCEGARSEGTRSGSRSDVPRGRRDAVPARGSPSRTVEGHPGGIDTPYLRFQVRRDGRAGRRLVARAPPGIRGRARGVGTCLAARPEPGSGQGRAAGRARGRRMGHGALRLPRDLRSRNRGPAEAHRLTDPPLLRSHGDIRRANARRSTRRGRAAGRGTRRHGRGAEATPDRTLARPIRGNPWVTPTRPTPDAPTRTRADQGGAGCERHFSASRPQRSSR